MAKTQRKPRLMWALPGFVVQVGGLFSGHPMVALAGAALLVAGLAHYIKSKGYSAAWGLWGVVPIMGVIILAMQRPHAEVSREEWLDDIILEDDPHLRSFLRKKPAEIVGGRGLLLAMAPIAVVLMIVCPYFPHLADRAADSQTESATVDGDGAVEQSDEVAADAVLVAKAEVATEPEAAADPSVADEPEPEVGPEVEAAAEPVEISFAERVAKIQLGMSYEDAAELAGPNVTRVAGTAVGDQTVNWMGSDGSFIVAKFVDDELVRRTPLRRAPETRQLERIAEEVFKFAVADAELAADEDAQQELDAGAPVTELAQADARPDEASEEVDARAEEVYAEDTEEEVIEEPQERRRVVRVGGESDGRGRTSYKKAKLPRYTRPIEHGPHDVHIHNSNPYRVEVAVRSGKRGKNLTLSADDEATIYVRNGRYALYYLEAEAPTRVTDAGSFTVDSPATALRVSLR